LRLSLDLNLASGGRLAELFDCLGDGPRTAGADKADAHLVEVGGEHRDHVTRYCSLSRWFVRALPLGAMSLLFLLLPVVALTQFMYFPRSPLRVFPLPPFPLLLALLLLVRPLVPVLHLQFQPTQ